MYVCLSIRGFSDDLVDVGQNGSGLVSDVEDQEPSSVRVAPTKLPSPRLEDVPET